MSQRVCAIAREGLRRLREVCDPSCRDAIDAVLTEFDARLGNDS